RQFASRAFWTVRGMHQIHLARAGEVSTDGARGGIKSIGRAQHFADDANDIQAFDRHSDYGCRCDEVFQAAIKGFRDVLCVVLLGKFRGNSKHFKGYDVESLGFETGQNLPHQTTLDTIRLEQYKTTLQHLLTPKLNGV